MLPAAVPLGLDSVGRDASVGCGNSLHMRSGALRCGPMQPTLCAEARRRSVIAHARRKVYAISVPAEHRGIYDNWNTVKDIVVGVSGAVHKGFPNEKRANAWLQEQLEQELQQEAELQEQRAELFAQLSALGHTTIHPTGHLTPNPAPGLVADPTSLSGFPATSSSSSVIYQTYPRLPQYPNTDAGPGRMSVQHQLRYVPPASAQYHNKYYAVRYVEGGEPAIFNSWAEAEGYMARCEQAAGVAQQPYHTSYREFKAFKSLDLAQAYLEEGANLARAAAAAARRSRYLGPQHPQHPQQMQAHDHQHDRYDHHNHYNDHHISSTQAWGAQEDGAVHEHGWADESGGWGEDGSGVGVGVGLQVDRDGVLRLKSDRPPLLQQAKQKAHQEQQQLHSTRQWWPQQQQQWQGAWDGGMGHPQGHTHANTQQEQEQLQYQVHQLAHPHAINYHQHHQHHQHHQLTGPGQLHQSTLHGWELQQDSPYPSEDVYSQTGVDADMDVHPHLQHEHQREVAPYAAGSANNHNHHDPHVYGDELYGNGQQDLAPGDGVGNGNDDVDNDEYGQDDSLWMPMPPLSISPHAALPAPPQLVTHGGLVPQHDARSSSHALRDRELARVHALVPASGAVAVGGDGGSSAVGSAAAVLPAAAGRAPSPQPVTAARDGMAAAAVPSGGRHAGPASALPQPVALTGAASVAMHAAGTITLHGSAVARVGEGAGCGGRRQEEGPGAAGGAWDELAVQQQQQGGEGGGLLGSAGKGTRTRRGGAVGSDAAAAAATASASRRSRSSSASVAAAPEAGEEQVAGVSPARRRRVPCSSKSGGAVAVGLAAAPAVLSHNTDTSNPGSSSSSKALLQGNIVPSQSLSAGSPIVEPAAPAKRPRKATRKDPVPLAPAVAHASTQQDGAAAGGLGAGPGEVEAAALQAVVHYAVCAWRSTMDADAFTHLRMAVVMAAAGGGSGLTTSGASAHGGACTSPAAKAEAALGELLAKLRCGPEPGGQGSGSGSGCIRRALVLGLILVELGKVAESAIASQAVVQRTDEQQPSAVAAAPPAAKRRAGGRRRESVSEPPLAAAVPAVAAQEAEASCAKAAASANPVPAAPAASTARSKRQVAASSRSVASGGAVRRAAAVRAGQRPAAAATAGAEAGQGAAAAVPGDRTKVAAAPAAKVVEEEGSCGRRAAVPARRKAATGAAPVLGAGATAKAAVAPSASTVAQALARRVARS